MSEEKLGKLTLEEIWDIPETVRKSVENHLDREKLKQIAQKIEDSNRISVYCLGSGTSYHAGLVATYWFSQLAHIPTHCELAPEFPYLVEPIIAHKHIAICISQSGESEFTVYSAKKAKEKGAFVIALTNEEQSTLAKIAGNNLLLTRAGQERSVLATKTYVGQLTLLTSLAIELAIIRETITTEYATQLRKNLEAIPMTLTKFLPKLRSRIRELAPYFKFAKNAFVIGAGPDYANCMEAALKLKEGARIYAQAFSTAEFPHGPITLAESHSAFVLVIIPPKSDNQRYQDIIKLIKRLKNRGVTILGIKHAKQIIKELDFEINIPECLDVFQPIYSIIPIQLLVVEIAAIQGMNADEPKYLSKISKI